MKTPLAAAARPPSRPSASRRDRGFTLIELLVGGAVSVFAIGLVMLTFLSQQRAFSSMDLTRQSTEAGRDALTEIEVSLRRLGYGIDPQYAIDMNKYRCAASPCCDSASGPDELVFVARNPNYQWHAFGDAGCTASAGCYLGNAWPVSAYVGSAPGGLTSITVVAQPGDLFHDGRLIQITCANGAHATMARVKGLLQATGVNQSLVVTLDPAAAPYQANDTSDACFGTPASPTNVSVFLVDRFRYAVKTFANQPDPWLVLDTGIDLNNNGTRPDGGDDDDLIPIAQGVEDLQVAYALAPGTAYGAAAPDNGADWIVGDTAGVQEELSTTATAPLYTTPISDPSRYNLHPANVRAIRITVGVRSLQSDATQPPGWQGDPVLRQTAPGVYASRENRSTQPAQAAWGRFKRYEFSSNTFLRNMDSRSPFIF